jgi:hypothetical protein
MPPDTNRTRAAERAAAAGRWCGAFITNCDRREPRPAAARLTLVAEGSGGAAALKGQGAGSWGNAPTPLSCFGSGLGG